MGNNNKLFEDIADYIIKEVQENSDCSMSGFQNTVEHSEIQERFAMEIEGYINEKILESLNNRKEVADVVGDTDGFDIVLYTDYAPNYIGEKL